MVRDSRSILQRIQWMKKKFPIYFLQEIHCSSDTEAYWRFEWGYSAICTNFSSSRAGVGILFSKNFQVNILRSFIDLEGRFTTADIEKKFELTDIGEFWTQMLGVIYTWRRGKKQKFNAVWIFFLASDTLCPKVLEAEILPGYRKDHSMITVRISAAAEDPVFGN